MQKDTDEAVLWAASFGLPPFQPIGHVGGEKAPQMMPHLCHERCHCFKKQNIVLVCMVRAYIIFSGDGSLHSLSYFPFSDFQSMKPIESPFSPGWFNPRISSR